MLVLLKRNVFISFGPFTSMPHALYIIFLIYHRNVIWFKTNLWNSQLYSFVQSCSRSENSCFLFNPQIFIMNGVLSWFFSASSNNCYHSNTSCFTKNCDDDVHATAVLKWCVVSYTMCASKIWLSSIWKIIILQLLNVRISHSPVVLPALKFIIPRFLAARKTVQLAECFKTTYPPT